MKEGFKRFFGMLFESIVFAVLVVVMFEFINDKLGKSMTIVDASLFEQAKECAKDPEALCMIHIDQVKEI